MTRETKQARDEQPQTKQAQREQHPDQRAQAGSGMSQQNSMTRQAGGAPDRERAIDSSRERGRQGGAATAPAWRDSFRDAPLGTHFARMERMAEDMDRLLEQFGFGRSAFGLAPSFGAQSPLLRSAARPGATSGQSLWNPQVEVFERGDNLVVRADLPGIRKEDVDVSVEDGMLTIRGERRDEREEKEEGFYRSERSYGQFYRAIAIPEGVNDDACDARYADGVLEVTLPLPKQQQPKSRRLTVR